MKKYFLITTVLLLTYNNAIAANCPIYETAKNRYLTNSELSACGCGELDLLRNEIFARHGRIFKRQSLQTFFSRHAWYKKGYPDSSGMKGQNKLEQKNVLNIRNEEKARNCKKGHGKSVGTYPAKSPEDKQLLEAARKYVDANSSDVRYKLKILKKLNKWALVDVIPLQELDPHMVIMEKMGGKWVAREMGTMLTEWEEKIPELFK